MRLRLFAMAVIAFLAVLPVSNAFAQVSGTTIGIAPVGSDEILVGGSATVDWLLPPSGAGSAGFGVPQPTTYILDPQLLPNGPGGSLCLYVGQKPGDPNSAEALANEVKTAVLSSQFPMCSGSGAAPATVSPAAAAAEAWRRVKLPKPTVWMAPGKAITGLEGCLEIGGPPSIVADFPDILGIAVHIQASSVYDVDWGDGSWLRGITDQGGPCPTGHLRHAYRYKGSPTISVHQRWTAAWSAGGQSGTISGVLETVGAMSLPVSEVQSVGG